MNCTTQDILKFIALMRRPKLCTEGFTLAHGQSFDVKPAPAGFKHGKMKLCFENAAHVVLKKPSRYVYCEGYVMWFGVTLHAWVFDLETRTAFDPTWKDFGDSYYGIPFRTSYLADALDRGEYYGLLDSQALDWELERGKIPTEVFRRVIGNLAPQENQFAPAD